MNRFILSEDPQEAAKYHNDKHVVKMILEEAQMLSTVHQLSLSDIHPDAANMLYRPTHRNHPCVVWLQQSTENYFWALRLFESLAAEYTFRYGKQHKSFGLHGLFISPPPETPTVGMTPFPLAMPEYCKKESPVDSYRTYYAMEKNDLAHWTRREQPDWWEYQRSLLAILV